MPQLNSWLTPGSWCFVLVRTLVLIILAFLSFFFSICLFCSVIPCICGMMMLLIDAASCPFCYQQSGLPMFWTEKVVSSPQHVIIEIAKLFLNNYNHRITIIALNA